MTVLHQAAASRLCGTALRLACFFAPDPSSLICPGSPYFLHTPRFSRFFSAVIESAEGMERFLSSPASGSIRHFLGKVAFPSERPPGVPYSVGGLAVVVFISGVARFSPAYLFDDLPLDLGFFVSSVLPLHLP